MEKTGNFVDTVPWVCIDPEKSCSFLMTAYSCWVLSFKFSSLLILILITGLLKSRLMINDKQAEQFIFNKITT